MPQQNGKHAKTENQLPGRSTQLRRKKLNGKDPTDNKNQKNTIGQKRQLRHQTENQRKVPKVHHRHWISGHNYSKQPEILQPEKSTTTKR